MRLEAVPILEEKIGSCSLWMPADHSPMRCSCIGAKAGTIAGSKDWHGA